jgi:hypothetical protein
MKSGTALAAASAAPPAGTGVGLIRAFILGIHRPDHFEISVNVARM